ncbi:hypothetical protein V6N13_126653 [Hibiscus sabdariffa]
MVERSLSTRESDLCLQIQNPGLQMETKAEIVRLINGCFSEWSQKKHSSVLCRCAPSVGLLCNLPEETHSCAIFRRSLGLKDNQQKRGRAFVSDEYDSEESDDNEGPRCPQCGEE